MISVSKINMGCTSLDFKSAKLRPVLSNNLKSLLNQKIVIFILLK
ncbi:MAG: Uncharacterised protein [Crocinitomicaceae bacterium]|nr:MAG: Uncharacterised protein [Crocinitomicaceae bacterium]